jgi:hypothetical protein
MMATALSCGVVCAGALGVLTVPVAVGVVVASLAIGAVSWHGARPLGHEMLAPLPEATARAATVAAPKASDVAASSSVAAVQATAGHIDAA